MRKSIFITAVAVFLLCSGTALATGYHHRLPSFIVPGSVDSTTYTGVRDAEGADDLLSGGLNSAGLQGSAPGFADPLNPTPAGLISSGDLPWRLLSAAVWSPA